MITIQVPKGTDWRAKFKILEMAFFNIPEEQWPIAFTQRIEQLTAVYDDLRHRAHIALLNTQLKLKPVLAGPEFDKTITLAKLREVVVEPRVPVSSAGTQTVTIALADHELDNHDMGHLRALKPKRSRHK
jgi:hypothetical protein